MHIKQSLVFKIISIISFILISFTAISSQGTNIQPSFNCSKATSEVEHLLCSNGNLALSDLILNDIYKLALKDNPSIRKEQRKWLLEERNKNCLRRKKLLKFDLESCYRKRIRAISQQVNIPAELNEKYTNILLSKGLVKLPSVKENPAKKFIALNNLKNRVIHMLGECQENGMSLKFWDGKHLIVNVHSDSVECTGRSVHYFGEKTYCLINSEFISTNNNFFSCKIPYENQDIVKLSKNYFENSADHLFGNIQTKEEFLSSLLGIIKDTKNPYLSGKWLYSNEAMEFVLANLNEIVVMSKPYHNAIINILDDLEKVHQLIIKTPEWEVKFNNYKPYVSHNYMDRNYTPISNGFKKSPDIEGHQITRYIHYSYNELYHRFWYKCYKQNSVQTAFKAITGLKKELLKYKIGQ